MKKRIIKKRSLYDFTMRSIHDYYRDMVKEYLVTRNFDESNVPSLFYIPESLDNLRDGGLSNTNTFRNRQ